MIFVTAGHGGGDPGASGNGYTEAALTKELFRVSKNQIVWGGNYFTDMLPVSRCWICWDKIQPWDNFSQFEMAWTSFDSPTKMISLSNRGGKNDKSKIHPTQKPEDLYKFCLNKFAKPGFTILDTHSGSGTLACACHDYGFDLVACEKEKTYFDSSVKRLNDHQKQLILL